MSRKEYDLYLMSEFNIERCQKMTGNAVILTNKNKIYFLIEDKIIMEDDKPQAVAGINRQEIVFSSSIEPVKYTASVSKKEEIIRESLSKGGYTRMETSVSSPTSDIDEKFRIMEEKFERKLKNQKSNIEREFEKKIINQTVEIKNLRNEMYKIQAEHINYQVEAQDQLEKFYQSNVKTAATITPFYHFCLDNEVKNLIAKYNQESDQLQLHVVAHIEKEQTGQWLKLSFFIAGLTKNENYNIEDGLSCNYLFTEYREQKLPEDNHDLSQKIEKMKAYLKFEFSFLREFLSEESTEIKIAKEEDLSFSQFINHCKNYPPLQSDVIKTLHIILERFFERILVRNFLEGIIKGLPNFEIGRTTTSEWLKHSARSGGHSVIFKRIKTDSELSEYEKSVAKRYKQDLLCHIVLFENGQDEEITLREGHTHQIENFRIIAFLNKEKFELSISKMDSLINKFKEEKLIGQYEKEINEFFELKQVTNQLIKPLQKNGFIFPIVAVKKFMIICRMTDFVRTHFKYMRDVNQIETLHRIVEKQNLIKKLTEENRFLMEHMDKNKIFTYFEEKNDHHRVRLNEIICEMCDLHKRKGKCKFFEESIVKKFLSNLVFLAGILDKIEQARNNYESSYIFSFLYLWTLMDHIENYRTLPQGIQTGLITKMNIFKDNLESHLSLIADIGGAKDFPDLRDTIYTSRYGYHT